MFRTSNDRVKSTWVLGYPATVVADRNLASEPKTIEVVKISFPQGLFLIAIS